LVSEQYIGPNRCFPIIFPWRNSQESCSYPEEPVLMKSFTGQKKKKFLQRIEIIPASPTDGQKFPRYCERSLECFAVFKKSYVFIPRSIAESLGSAESSWGSSGLKYRFHDFHALGHIAKFPANKYTWKMGIIETPRSDKV